MEQEILIEEKEAGKTAEQEYTGQEDELVELVKEKHNGTKKQERISDVFIIQLILTVLLILVFAVINIFDNELVEWFIDEFKRRSMGETEKIIKDAVNYAVGVIK